MGGEEGRREGEKGISNLLIHFKGILIIK